MNDLVSGESNFQTMPTKSIAILTFRTNGQVYGLPITAVRQLIEMVTIVALPQAPPAIQGVINVHGQIVPVLDMRLRFGMAFKPYQLRTPIILLEANGRSLGLVVDEVETVIEVNPVDAQTSDRIFDPLAKDALGQTTYLSSIAKVNDQIVMILDVACLLNSQQATNLTQFLAHPQTRSDTQTIPETEMAGV